MPIHPRLAPPLATLTALLIALGLSAGAGRAAAPEAPSVSEAFVAPLPAGDPPAREAALQPGAARGITPAELDGRSFLGFYQVLGPNQNFVQAFTVSAQTAFYFQAAFPGDGEVAIINNRNLPIFKSGMTYPYYARFKNQTGTKFLTLLPGKYWLGARVGPGGGAFSAKLDREVNLPHYERVVNTELLLDPVEPHHYLAQGFQVTFDSQFFVDGCNSRMPCFIMTDTEYAKYQQAQPFQYLAQYSGDDPSLPGPWTLGLSGGHYFLVFENQTDHFQSAAYFLEGWTPKLPPNAPTNLQAKLQPNGGIDVTWEDNASNEVNNFLEKKAQGAKYVAQKVGRDTTSVFFARGTLKANTTYFFRVRAKNAEGYSAYSNEVSVKTTR